MSDTAADAAKPVRGKPKPKASKKRPAEGAPADAQEPAIKKERGGGASASASALASSAGARKSWDAERFPVPDKYNLKAQPKIQVADWKLNNFELFGNLCSGGTKRQHELKVRTPPALVRVACLEGLGEKGYKQDADTASNKLTIELVFGDLPQSILAKHPKLEDEHQHFIQYMKDLIEAAKDVLQDSSAVRPGAFKTIKSDVKAEGLVGEAMKAEARERFFHDLKVHINFFEKEGKQMMSLPLECKAMKKNDEANPRLFQQPGAETEENLYNFLTLVGEYAPYQQNVVRYFNLRSERLFENEIAQDPWFKVVNRGSICAVDMNIRVYSHDPKDDGTPDYWAVKPSLCHEMVRVFPEDETPEFKQEADRILDVFDCPPPEEDEYAEGW